MVADCIDREPELPVQAIRQKADPLAEVPIVSCPLCSARMRIASAEPNPTNNRLHITFGCDCGFEYGMSERVANEVVRDF